MLAERGVAYREAHEAVGRLAAWMISEGRDLSSVTVGELEAAHLQFFPDDLELIEPEVSVRRRLSPGGGSFASVADQIQALRRRLTAH